MSVNTPGLILPANKVDDAIFLLASLRFRTDVFAPENINRDSAIVSQINGFLREHEVFEPITHEQMVRFFGIFNLRIERDLDSNYSITLIHSVARALLALETLAPLLNDRSEIEVHFERDSFRIESFRELEGLYKLRVEDKKLYAIKGETHVIYDEQSKKVVVADNTPRPLAEEEERNGAALDQINELRRRIQDAAYTRTGNKRNLG